MQESIYGYLSTYLGLLSCLSRFFLSSKTQLINTVRNLVVFL